MRSFSWVLSNTGTTSTPSAEFMRKLLQDQKPFVLQRDSIDALAQQQAIHDSYVPVGFSFTACSALEIAVLNNNL